MATLTRACRLTIHLGNADIEHHQPLAVQILHRAHQGGLAGATALHGVEGYGHSGKIHDTPRWSVVDRAPVIIVIVDTPQRIRDFLPRLDDIVDQCLVTIDTVEASGPAITAAARHSP